jgi:colanic acid biosynthesis glycosyl transferase WcaI
MQHFDMVSTISQRMFARAFSKGVASGRVVLFTNWVDMAGLVTGVSEMSKLRLGGYRAKLGIAADAVVALYSGNMGGKQGLEILAQAASLSYLNPSTLPHLQRGEGQKNLVFVFCGNGSGRADLVAMCDGLQNVRFLDLQPLERLGELLAMADIHLLPQRADAADLVMPSKLTGMLASGRPVVATAHIGTELANVVIDFGLVVPPEQPQAFADAITKLAQDAPLRARLGVAGRKYAEMNLDRDAVLRKFETELIKATRRSRKW